MVRFKVIKGSHLVLAISIIVLLAVVLMLVFGRGSQPKSVNTQNSTASAVAVYANADANALHISVIPDAETVMAEVDAPSVLIYHTHTHEAYQQDENDPYEAIETWRTVDYNHSVVRVGAALTDELRSRGFNVTHDTTDHELNDINNSYVRSLKTLEGYEESFDLCIDLHRDAYSPGLLTKLESDGQAYAQVMMLVGQGNNYPETERADYKSNLAFAREVTLKMNRIIPNICRNVNVKDGRYNQHIGKNALLIEVGHNMNTLNEALASIPCLADAISEVFSQKT